MIRKIISYNVNGLRSAIASGFIDWLKAEDPDILCMQETKSQDAQIDCSAFEILGYHHFWHSAEKKGYSGVGILTKIKPTEVVHGTGIDLYDKEGRCILADFGELSVMSVYVPSGISGNERQEFKMKWLDDLLDFMNNLRKDRPNLLISGDYNISHKPIDIHHPEKHQNVSGFLPEERKWMDKFIASGFVDSFREFNQLPDQYTWWNNFGNARAKNLGWRLDYHMITTPLKEKLRGAKILPNVFHSDHCPIVVEIDI